jgi:outer membrane receptor protein involved in Fe transport
MRSTLLYAPDGMTSAGMGSTGMTSNGMGSNGRHAERFDDGLVHNHHWAAGSDDAYGGHGHGGAHQRRILTDADMVAIRRRAAVAHDHDRHDDGLVHNHHWAVSGR